MAISPKILVTGATGQLGGLVVDALLETLPANTVIAGVRDVASQAAVALTGKGVEVRVADYADPTTLASALSGVERLLLISGSEVGRRKAQHRNVIAAAKQAGVGFIAYTSILHADTSPLFLAEEHRDTEAALAASGVPHTILRNGWYTEVYTWRLPLALERGELLGAAANGRISSAARADYAHAAAAVLTGESHAGRIYELAGDEAFTMTDLARVSSEAAGRAIAYRDMEPAKFRAALLDVGVAEMLADILSDTDAGVAKGALFDEGGELAQLIGRPTTPMRTIISPFVASGSARL